MSVQQAKALDTWVWLQLHMQDFANTWLQEYALDSGVHCLREPVEGCSTNRWDGVDLDAI
eukprot:70199-Amphidinium_carterae.2